MESSSISESCSDGSTKVEEPMRRTIADPGMTRAVFLVTGLTLLTWQCQPAG
jgi:hypothetical protein